ncbi:MAG: WD40 repeat domain-containing protein [Leptospira sp.]|uniref:Vgb family protein n=1 Tax=Leptospira sp. TaxID=178 RepID=UPI0025BCB492|nr:WD40 repeat domain-containing protein [Leptospira sp.]MBL0954681.1 WD40 repeat domain-containing protein [Leptospira sp.]
MLRNFTLLIFVIFLSHCTNGNISNNCDVGSENYINSLLLRFVVKDRSYLCGYKVRIPACSLSYEETHLPENWIQVKQEVETQFALGSSGEETLIKYNTNTVAAVTGAASTAFQGALIAPNGNVYLLPYNSPKIVTINPITKNYESAATVPGNVDFIGGTLGPNGIIYLSPHTNNTFFKLDTSNNTLTNITSISMGGAAYNGGVYAPNGKIYYVPSGESTIRYYDTKKGTIGSVATPVSGGIFANGVLTPEGKIYFIPHTATNIHILDTFTESVTTIPFSFGGASNYISGIYTPNGRIYIIPYNASTVYYVDTKDNDKVVNAGTIPSAGTAMFNGVVLAPNGRLYPIPLNYANFISIDSNNSEIRVLMANPSTNSYRGGVIGQAGEIYLSPHSSNRFDLLDTKSIGSFCDSVRLSPYWNKF